MDKKFIDGKTYTLYKNNEEFEKYLPNIAKISVANMTKNFEKPLTETLKEMEIKMTKQIDIKELIPFMNDGWVACDKSGTWVWFDKKPFKDDLDDNIWICHKGWLVSDLSKAFNIAPAKDWTKSLMKVGGK